MASAEHSNPERDRRLAAQVRHGPRRSVDVAALAARFLDSPAMRQAKRNGTVMAVLHRVLPRPLADATRIARWQGRRLDLEVDAAPLLDEARNYHHHRILECLAAAGVSVADLHWRLRRSAQRRG